MEDNENKPLSEMSTEAIINENYNFEDRLQVPYIEKKNGDEMLKQGKLEEAMKHFSKAIMSIKILNDEKVIGETTLQKMIKEVGVPSNLNISYCYINQKDWRGALPHLDRVIEFDKKHVKALYRRCLCKINLNKFEEADDDLMTLEDLIGGSKELEDLEEMFEKKQKQGKTDEKTIYSRMFKQYVNGK
jgi:tetratricopeptide (TPR) repeat protein